MTRISCILPAHGDGRFLGAALRSVACQHRPVDEIVIIDDGLLPEIRRAVTLTISPQTRTVWVDGPATGRPSAARNVGLAVATGEVIAFLDDDDLWPANKISEQMRFLETNPHHGLVGGQSNWFDTWDEDLWPAQTGQSDLRQFYNLGAFLMRRSVFSEIGLFDSALRFAEDVDFIMRVMDADIQLAMLDIITLHYRRRPGSMTADRGGEEMSDFRRALLKAANRRRGKKTPALADLIVPWTPCI